MQSQMIYPQKNVAAMIAGRLAKSKGVEYGVTKVATGFKVAPVVPVIVAIDLATKPSTNFAIQAANAEALMVNSKVMASVTVWGSVEVSMRLKSIGDEWIHATHQGKPFWISKKSILSFASGDVDGHKMITMVMSKPYAQKRGLI